MSRIQARFESLARERRKALIPYITAGDPHPSLTVPRMRASRGGGTRYCTPSLYVDGLLDRSTDLDLLYSNRHNILEQLGYADLLIGAVLLFCSDASSFITGQTVNVDGGHRFH